MKTIFERFAKDELGATAIEYGLIASLIAVAIIAGATALGTALNTTFDTLSGKDEVVVAKRNRAAGAMARRPRDRSKPEVHREKSRASGLDAVGAKNCEHQDRNYDLEEPPSEIRTGRERGDGHRVRPDCVPDRGCHHRRRYRAGHCAQHDLQHSLDQDEVVDRRRTRATGARPADHGIVADGSARQTAARAPARRLESGNQWPLGAAAGTAPSARYRHGSSRSGRGRGHEFTHQVPSISPRRNRRDRPRILFDRGLYRIGDNCRGLRLWHFDQCRILRHRGEHPVELTTCDAVTRRVVAPRVAAGAVRRAALARTATRKQLSVTVGFSTS